VATWTEYDWDGQEGWLWDGKLFISDDYNPETGVAMAFFAPPGGRAAVPAMAAGDTGATGAPGATGGTGPTGATGPTGSLLGATDIVGSPLAGYDIVYSTTAGPGSTPAGVWTPPGIGGVYWPSSISSTTSSDGAQRTLASVTVPSFPFDARVECFGQSILTGTGPDCTADLIARITNATSGDIVARKYGLPLSTPQDLTLIPGPAAGSATSLGKIAANSGTVTVYLRAERQTGADSFSTSSSTTSFYVKVVRLP
jgi:hypothetical protein